MERLLRVMRTLRGPDGCPWVREQTHASLRPFLLEEVAETVAAPPSALPTPMRVAAPLAALAADREQLGAVLPAPVQLARRAGIDPETALRPA